jgi:class 3 adenylate cyclase/tetratricopeptide (TPR) repeat protein
VNERTKELESAIISLEAQRSVVGDSVVDSAVAALRRQLAELDQPIRKPSAQEERKIVTILFADVSGFTTLSEKLDPEEVRNLINSCFERLVPIVRKYEGTVDKFIGDEIMVLFGAPVAHENDPERALRVALEMMAAIAVFNRDQAIELNIHVGVNSGPVVAGQVGAEERRDYSVMGDAVNVAARLAHAANNGEIYVGPSTYRQAAAFFDFETLPALTLEGKEKPVEGYRLVGLKAEQRRARRTKGFRSPLVGRQSELAEIQSAFQNLCNGRGSVLTVIGEAGVGKSRLVSEALQLTDLRWAEGRALSYSEGMNYWMARDLLRALLGTSGEATVEEIDKALRNSVQQTAPNETDKIYPYLGRLLEIPLSETAEQPLKFLTSEALQTRILGAFREYVRALALGRPLILFWEDLHWCDPSSRRVLETLMPLTQEVPLFLLLTYRPDANFGSQLHERASSIDAENCRLLSLLPLTREEGSSMIRGLLKMDVLPEKLRAILDRAEGNPFFLEELLRSLLDAGIVVVEKDRIVATDAIATVTVPETLQSVLMARIDCLTAENKRTLQNAAVIGRIFPQRILANICDDGQPASKDRLADSLAELERREFIQPGKLSEEPEYIFKHAITHDVAYNSLLIARRRQLHGRVGEAMEALFPDRLDELSPTLGYHFERAEAREKAIRYLQRAADCAQATFANTEALAFYQSAMCQVELLLGTRTDEALAQTLTQIQENIGDIEHLIGRQEEARAAYESALCSLPKNDAIWASRLRRKQAKTWTIEREHARAGQCYDEAEKVLQDCMSSTMEWQREWLQVQLDRMWLHYWRGEVDQIAALAKGTRPMVEQHATVLQRGNFFQGLTLMALRRDRYTANDETITHAQTSLEAIEESGVLPEIGHARFVLGFAWLWAGKFEMAEKWISDALELTEKTGEIVLQSRCLTYLAVIERRRGEVENTRRYAEQSLASATAAKMVEYIGMAKGNLAWVDLRNGEVASAFEHASGGVEDLRQTPQGHILLWVALWPLIGVQIERAQISEAIDHLETLLTPPQMAIPGDLESAMRVAVDAWERNDQDTAKFNLGKTANLARQIGYL